MLAHTGRESRRGEGERKRERERGRGVYKYLQLSR